METPELMHTTPRLLDVVALLSDVSSHGLLRGQVGTVVELLDGAYEVEFSEPSPPAAAGAADHVAHESTANPPRRDAPQGVSRAAGRVAGRNASPSG
jgi:hypothetical protein